MIDAVVAGHLCIDIIPSIPAEAVRDSDHFLAPGRLVEVGAAVLSTGGAVSNTGLALDTLGIDVRLVARVGDDLIADLTRSILAARGDDLIRHLRVARGEPSSYTVVISPPGRDRSFLHCAGTNNSFVAEDVPAELLGQARLLHFGYPPLMRRMYADDAEQLTLLMRTAHEQGTSTSLDMALPDPSGPSGRVDWHRALEQSLPYVDLFEPSFEELCFMLRRDRYQALLATARDGDVVSAATPEDVSGLAEEALGLGAGLVLIKLGERGAYLRTGALDRLAARGAPTALDRWRRRELWAPCFRVEVAGTVGAGDATIAGFLAGVLRGQDPEAALTSAVAVGACNVEAADATSGVRPWEETQGRIASGWARRDARIDALGWRWDGDRGVWRGPHDGSAEDRT